MAFKSKFVGKPKMGGLGTIPPYKPKAKPKPVVTKPKPGLGKPNPAKTPVPVAARTPQAAQPDSAYLNRVDLAGRKETSALGELEGQEAGIKHEFGLDDPTNPFSRAEGLKRSFLARQKAASAGLASQGQLYSGAHERAVGRTRREEEEARAELRRTYEGAIGQIGAAKAGVKFATEEERAQAFEDWLSRAPEAEYDLGPTEPEIDAPDDLSAPMVTPGPAPYTAVMEANMRPSGPVVVGSEPQAGGSKAERARAAAREEKRQQKLASARAEKQARQEAMRGGELAILRGRPTGGGSPVKPLATKPKPRPKAKRGRR